MSDHSFISYVEVDAHKNSFVERKLFSEGEGGPLFERSWAGAGSSESNPSRQEQADQIVEKVLLRGAELRAMESQWFTGRASAAFPATEADLHPPGNGFPEHYVAFEEDPPEAAASPAGPPPAHDPATDRAAAAAAASDRGDPAPSRGDTRYTILTEDDFLVLLSDEAPPPHGVRVAPRSGPACASLCACGRSRLGLHVPPVFFQGMAWFMNRTLVPSRPGRARESDR